MDLGLRAIHPITGREVPVLVANYVLMDYGTGAVMAVPAHDQRDWEFATKMSLPIEQVIAPAGDEDIDLDKQAFTEKGVLVNSGEFDNGWNLTPPSMPFPPNWLSLAKAKSPPTTACATGVFPVNATGVHQSPCSTLPEGW